MVIKIFLRNKYDTPYWEGKIKNRKEFINILYNLFWKLKKQHPEEFAYNQELEFINDSDDHLSLKDNNNLDIYYGITLKLNDKFEIWCNGITYRECRDCTSMEFYMITNEILSINDFVDWFEKLEIDF